MNDTTTSADAPKCCWRMHGPRLTCGCECHRTDADRTERAKECLASAMGASPDSKILNEFEGLIAGISSFATREATEAVAHQMSQVCTLLEAALRSDDVELNLSMLVQRWRKNEREGETDA